ncbi:nitrous oxide reductase family maturation protein NosD [Candidatus Bipolaricaulota bacterium]
MLLAIVSMCTGIVGCNSRGLSSKVVLVEQGESLQLAIDAANPGTVIELAPGEWVESIVVAKPLTIRARSARETRIVGRASRQTTISIESEGDVRLEGLVFSRNSDSLAGDSSAYEDIPRGVVAKGESIVTIHDCEFIGVEAGVVAEDLSKLSISDCTFSVMYLGIYVRENASAAILATTLRSTENRYDSMAFAVEDDGVIEVKGSEVSGTDEWYFGFYSAFDLWERAQVSVSDSLIQDVYVGSLLRDWAEISFSDSESLGTVIGVELRDHSELEAERSDWTGTGSLPNTGQSAVMTYGSNAIDLEDCKIRGFSTGIGLGGRTDSLLMRCKIWACGGGIELRDSSSIILVGSNVESCNTGLTLRHTSQAELESCIFESNDVGIELDDQVELSIVDSIVHSERFGVATAYCLWESVPSVNVYPFEGHVSGTGNSVSACCPGLSDSMWPKTIIQDEDHQGQQVAPSTLNDSSGSSISGQSKPLILFLGDLDENLANAVWQLGYSYENEPLLEQAYLTPEMLSPYSIVVWQDCDITQRYIGSDDVQSIVEYVANGGSLFIGIPMRLVMQEIPRRVNPLIEHFGIRANADKTRSPCYLYGDHFSSTDHAISAGIEGSIYWADYQAGLGSTTDGYTLSVRSPARSIFWEMRSNADQDSLLAVCKYEYGRVVVMGGGAKLRTLTFGDYINQGDTFKLLGNILGWLL